jgi:hypothetical protein
LICDGDAITRIQERATGWYGGVARDRRLLEFAHRSRYEFALTILSLSADLHLGCRPMNAASDVDLRIARAPHELFIGRS